jgi:hypothetical protein
MVGRNLPDPCKSRETGRINVSRRRDLPLSPDKAIDIRDLQTVFYAKEQGRIFVDQGA